MTSDQAAAGAPAADGPPAKEHGTGWRSARREVAVAVVLALAISAAAWVLEGPAAAGFAALAAAALSLVALRALIEPGELPEAPHQSHELGPSTSFLGFWRTHSDMGDAITSLSAWNSVLRPRLTNLLAARLSERHGISLANDPEAARRVLTGGMRGRTDLWAWIDPRRQAAPGAGSLPGIPPRVLAALIDRLERL